MSASNSPQGGSSEEHEPAAILYDPTDPFWDDTDEDNDDIDFAPAPGDSQDDEDEDEDEEAFFHGMRLFQKNVFSACKVIADQLARCGREPRLGRDRGRIWRRRRAR
jgi:hypothetical protein